MERQGKRESWDRFTGSYNARQQGANLSLDIQPPEDWDPASGRRARLSLAIQDLRIERLLLPLYRGGTAINITPSVLSGSDVSVEVVPLDPNIRAIWRALEAGTREHAAAVRDHVFRVKGPLPIEALAAADPWEAMLAGLLFLRFPEEFGELSPEWTRILCERHQWAADAFVIRARQIASAAARSPETIGESARQAVRLLTAAQACGSPYFSITNLYFNELVEGLSSVPGLSGEVTDALTRARRRWQRELPLQRSAGITFSWLSRDQNLLKKKRILAPKQDVSGRLSGRNTTIVFKGQIRAGAIAFEAPSSVAPKRTDAPVGSAKMGAVPNGSSSFHPSAPDDCPALSRPPGPDDDPNNGRFGGQTEVIGFRLGAQFPEDNAKAVTIVLSVDAGEHTQVELGDCVWFCLHPTFNPEWVRVLFQGRRASLTVRAWGGFTVGAWLPTQQVELECDLASIDDAPRIIKDR